MKNIARTLCLYCLLFSISTSVYAQGGVGINSTGAQPDPSAMLDIYSLDKGFLPPRMTTAERDAISNPATGLHIYNADTDCVNIYVGSTWKQVCPDCDFSLPAVSSNSPICEGSTLNLMATSISGATYQWTGPNGFTSTLQNPSISNATAAASGAYSVQLTVSGCTGTPVSTAVTVTATPQTPVAANNGPLCEGATLDLSASNIVGATYSWTGPNGFTSSQQNPSVANVTQSDAGTYNVVADVSGCQSATGSTNVTIDAIPAAPVAAAATNVGETTFDANWNASSGATGYYLDVATDINFTAFVSGYSNLNVGNVTTYTVSGLSGFSTYYFRVRADHSCGTSSHSDTLSVSTSGTLDVTFTNCSQTGRFGPSQSQCNTAYSGTDLAGNVTVTDGIQRWTVPITGVYKITAYGAEGGDNPNGRNSGHLYKGGLGATVEGNFSLTQGDVLKIIVGQKGVSTTGYGAGGAGGTFVAYDNNTPLIVAGGGGGAGYDHDGNNAPNIISTSGSQGGYSVAHGQTESGAGFHLNSANGAAYSFVNGGNGAQTSYSGSDDGGFGGGGGGGSSCMHAGGGGYSGGAPGYCSWNSTPNACCMSDGGTSYNDGTSVNNFSGLNSGPGKVEIEYLP